MQLTEIGRWRAPRTCGRAADALAWLAGHGFAIPRSWVASADSLDAATDLESEFAAALMPIVRDDATYTLRTSTRPPGTSDDIAEDDPASYASEETVTGLAGAREIASEAVRVRARAFARLAPPDDRPQSIERLREGPLPRPEVSLVLSEEPAVRISGTAYSSNPLTALDEVVVEAVRGPSALLGRTDIVPDRWVRKWGAWQRRPVASDISTLPITEAADKAAEAQRRIGWPVQLDWVYDGHYLYFTDVRDLDSVQGVNFYSNLVAREFLPGIQPPLVWAVNVPVVIGAWIRLLTEMVGDTGLGPHDITRAFFYRAYFDMGALARLFDMAGLPRETLEMLVLGGGTSAPEAPRLRLTARSLLRAPRAIGFAATKVRLGAQVENELPMLEERLSEFDAGPAETDLTARQVMDRIDDLLPIVEDAAYLNAITPLASAVYMRLFARQLLEELELEPDEIAFDTPAHPAEAELDRLAEAAAALPEGTAAAARAGRIARVRATKSGAAFIADVERFLRVYGYLGAADSDFSSAPWREDLPGTVRMIASRSHKPARSKVPRSRLAEMGASPALLRAFDRASRWKALSEQVSDAYARAYGRLRPLHLRLGDILVRRGWIDDPSDVFLLTTDALEQALSFGLSVGQVRMAVAQRAIDLAHARSISAPDVIFGEFAPEPVPAGCETLSGAGGAAGYHSGTTVVVEHPAEAERVGPDDVAIVPALDGDWRSVVRRAGAVVCEAGGFDSAVATYCRELGVPCAVGVEGAAAAIGAGTDVVVDGYRGSVRIVSWAEVLGESESDSQASRA